MVITDESGRSIFCCLGDSLDFWGTQFRSLAKQRAGRILRSDLSFHVGKKMTVEKLIVQYEKVLEEAKPDDNEGVVLAAGELRMLIAFIKGRLKIQAALKESGLI